MKAAATRQFFGRSSTCLKISSNWKLDISITTVCADICGLNFNQDSVHYLLQSSRVQNIIFHIQQNLTHWKFPYPVPFDTITLSTGIMYVRFHCLSMDFRLFFIHWFVRALKSQRLYRLRLKPYLVFCKKIHAASSKTPILQGEW